MVATENAPTSQAKQSRLEIIRSIAQSHLRKSVPDFRVGDTVRVYVKIIEGDRARLQPFEGIVIRRHRGSGISATFTVRRISYGEGVEKIFPLHAPTVDRIEVLKRGDVKRAKLYYLRHAVTQKVDEIDPTQLRSVESGAPAAKPSKPAKPAAASEKTPTPAR